PRPPAARAAAGPGDRRGGDGARLPRRDAQAAAPARRRRARRGRLTHRHGRHLHRSLRLSGLRGGSAGGGRGDGRPAAGAEGAPAAAGAARGRRAHGADPRGDRGLRLLRPSTAPPTAAATGQRPCTAAGGDVRPRRSPWTTMSHAAVTDWWYTSGAIDRRKVN